MCPTLLKASIHSRHPHQITVVYFFCEDSATRVNDVEQAIKKMQEVPTASTFNVQLQHLQKVIS